MWRNTLRGEQDSLPHLTISQLQCEPGNGSNSRAMQRVPQLVGELSIRHRIRRDNIDRPTHPIGGNRVIDGANDVIERHPTHPLLAITQFPAGAELEWRQHLLERPTGRTKDDPKPREHRTDATLTGRRSRSLPHLRHLGEKPSPWRRALVE